MILQTALLIALLAFLFAVFRELSEHAKEGGFIGSPAWWNTPTSAENKNEWGPKYLPFLPEKVSTFLFRKVLIWMTDAEHFFQLNSLICVIAGIGLLGGWQMALVAYLSQAFAGFLKIFTPLK